MKAPSADLIKKILFPLLALGLLYWAFTKINIAQLIETLKTANYFWVGAAFVAGILSHLIRALRWKMLISPLGYDVRVRTGFYAVMTGYLVNIVTPRVGEVARCALFHETDKVPVDKLLGTVVTERIFDMLITIGITLAVIYFQMDLIGRLVADLFAENNGTGQLIKLGIVAGVGLIGLAAYFIFKNLRSPDKQSPWVQKAFAFASGLIDGAKSIFSIKRPLLFVFYTLMIWFMYFLMTYLTFFALDVTSQLGIQAALTTLVLGTIAVIIPAPGGFGSFHYFVPLGLTLFGVTAVDGLAYATISHTTQMVMIAIVGGISVMLAGQEKKSLTA